MAHNILPQGVTSANHCGGPVQAYERQLISKAHYVFAWQHVPVLVRGQAQLYKMPQVAIACGHAYINKVGGLAAAQLLSFLCQASLSQSGQPSHI